MIETKKSIPTLALVCPNTGSLIPGHALSKYSPWRQVVTTHLVFSRERQCCPRKPYPISWCMLSNFSPDSVISVLSLERFPGHTPGCASDCCTQGKYPTRTRHPTLNLHRTRK